MVLVKKGAVNAWVPVPEGYSLSSLRSYRCFQVWCTCVWMGSLGVDALLKKCV